MCYVIAPAGLELLEAHEGSGWRSCVEPAPRGAASAHERRLRQARHEVHVTGWVLALEHALGGGPLPLRGGSRATISPPLRSTPAGQVAIGPRELRLPGGRTPHGFLRTDAAGARVEVERFETLRPDASVAARGLELLIERDDRLPTGAAAAKLERYDHLLAGWSLHAPRFARRGAPRPLVVFLCRDRPRARECARCADQVLSACRAYAGEYPHDWEYPGRAAILFAAERDVHEGSLLAYGVQRLPPDVRAAAHAGSGDELAVREPELEVRELIPRDG